MEQLIKVLSSRFDLLEVKKQRSNLLFLTLKPSQVVDVLTSLRNSESFRHLVMISAVDYIEEGVFQLTYLLHNYQRHVDIGIRVNVDREEAYMESIHHLWAAAQVYQRELNEMYGINFPGSPNIDEPMLLEGWDQIPPMRREFDTKKYSEETFFPRPGRQSFDPKKVMEDKAYPFEKEIKYEIKNIVRGNRDK